VRAGQLERVFAVKALTRAGGVVSEPLIRGSDSRNSTGIKIDLSQERNVGSRKFLRVKETPRRGAEETPSSDEINTKRPQLAEVDVVRGVDQREA